MSFDHDLLSGWENLSEYQVKRISFLLYLSSEEVFLQLYLWVMYVMKKTYKLSHWRGGLDIFLIVLEYFINMWQLTTLFFVQGSISMYYTGNDYKDTVAETYKRYCGTSSADLVGSQGSIMSWTEICLSRNTTKNMWTFSNSPLGSNLKENILWLHHFGNPWLYTNP